jgi:hypothetical protein
VSTAWGRSMPRRPVEVNATNPGGGRRLQRRQASITLRQMARMVESNPRLAEQTDAGVPVPAVRATHRLHTCRPASGAGALQGWNPSLAIVDESHVVTCVVCREPGRRQTQPVADPGHQHPGPVREGDVGPGCGRVVIGQGPRVVFQHPRGRLVDLASPHRVRGMSANPRRQPTATDAWQCRSGYPVGGTFRAWPAMAAVARLACLVSRAKGGELCGLTVLDGDGPGAGGLDFEELRSSADLAGPGVGTGGVDEAMLGAVCAERSHLEVQALVVSGDLDE